jgi:putative transposase
MNSIRRKTQDQLISLHCPEEKLAALIVAAKVSFEDVFAALKSELVHYLLFSNREFLAGPKYSPNKDWENWGTQEGSVYVVGERLRVRKPRLRKRGQEVTLPIYEDLNDRARFSQEVLLKALRGISCRNYTEALDGLLENFGLSKSSISRHLREATIKQLKELQERSLKGIEPFAIFIDGYYIGSAIFIVGLLVDMDGKKHVLGFWEGATENHEICAELFNNLENRGLNLTSQILFVVDGGKGVIKALKDRFGQDLIYQRCTVHKDRNIQKHLPKKYRQEAHRRFRNSIDCATYTDAKEELKDLEKWLEGINPSAAESLRECFEELLTIHRLRVPPLLRKTLHSTNPIESMFSQVSRKTRKITSMKRGKMAQRWVATALLDAEKRFRTVKGYLQISEVKDRIKTLQRENKAKAV